MVDKVCKYINIILYNKNMEIKIIFVYYFLLLGKNLKYI